MMLVNSLDQERMSPDDLYFATLTYPAEFPTARASKKHLAAFRRRLERAWGRMAVLWRLEPQKRGAPHYHLLIYVPGGLRGIHEFRHWLSTTWYEVVGSGDERHLRAGTNCERVRTWGGVSTYVGKYMSKVEHGQHGLDQWHEPGRMWGVWRREYLPITYERVNVTKHEAQQIRRVMVKRYEHLGTGRWHIRWPVSGRVERRYMPLEVANMIRAENPGIVMFEYKRKWRQRSGGISCFINYRDVIRYIETCWKPSIST